MAAQVQIDLYAFEMIFGTGRVIWRRRQARQFPEMHLSFSRLQTATMWDILRLCYGPAVMVLINTAKIVGPSTH
jgi:hypothetical protein